MIYNKTKDFRIEGSLVRDTNTLNNLIHSYVEEDNIVTEGSSTINF